MIALGALQLRNVLERERALGAVDKAGWGLRQQGRQGKARSSRRLFPFLILVMGLALSGCMEALRPGVPPVGQPPAGIATITSEPTQTMASTVPVGSPELPTLTPEASILPTLETMPTAPVPEQVPTETMPTAPVPEQVPTLVLPTMPALSNEARWRAQQIDRVVFDSTQTYMTTSSDLWWFDPVNQQSIILGTIAGDFTVQAEFVLQSQGRNALEVPYQVNQSYGLTALSPAILDRITAAGYTGWIETYVFRAPNVVRR